MPVRRDLEVSAADDMGLPVRPLALSDETRPGATETGSRLSDKTHWTIPLTKPVWSDNSLANTDGKLSTLGQNFPIRSSSSQSKSTGPAGGRCVV